MPDFILSYDLGTGGCKAALFDLEGSLRVDFFSPYPTFYPPAPGRGNNGWHEQRPEDWWQAVVDSTRALLAQSGADSRQIAGIGISGQSLAAVPLDRQGRLLRAQVPIWSDSRAGEQAQRFFTRVDETEWYRTTGNGFPAPLYTIFKLMWYQQHEAEMFSQVNVVLGSKDYINYRLTRQIATDYSYASGSGVYDLRAWGYSPRLVQASGLPGELLPPILPSTAVIGELTPAAADALGLPRTLKVVAGGVDNSCMALGARNICAGRIYTSHGSSSWIAVTAETPLTPPSPPHFVGGGGGRSFVFAHVIPGLFNSATSLFSSGSSLRWVRDQMCRDLVDRAHAAGEDVYELMTAEAATAAPGCRGVMFNPSLAGGSAMDPSPNLRGAFIGLELGHTRAELIRAVLEGVALELRIALDALRQLTDPAPITGWMSDEMLVVGGGSRSALWRQIFADTFDLRILKTNIDQQAAALGAAALAAVGTGLWPDFSIIDRIHRVEEVSIPIPANVALYASLLPRFRLASQYLADIGDRQLK